MKSLKIGQSIIYFQCFNLWGDKADVYSPLLVMDYNVNGIAPPKITVEYWIIDRGFESFTIDNATGSCRMIIALTQNSDFNKLAVLVNNHRVQYLQDKSKQCLDLANTLINRPLINII